MRFRSKSGDRGFTLIEMVVVISMILVLLSIALPMYSRAVINARETTLRANLETLRKVIQQYTLDKQKAPQSLDDLVQAKYIRTIPNDITGRNDTWQVEQEDSIMSPDQTAPGIVDVHSGSNQSASDGSSVYSSW
jgi:general secretion pathway protein G